jgi:hypothetical protein
MVDGDDNVALRSRKGEEVERGWYYKGIEVYVRGVMIGAKRALTLTSRLLFGARSRAGGG